MTPRSALSRVEFCALLAMLFATIALSINPMLPALPAILGMSFILSGTLVIHLFSKTALH